MKARATRRTQPYRKGTARQPGGALSAMVAGKPFYLGNPADVQRNTAKMAKRRKSRRDRLL